MEKVPPLDAVTFSITRYNLWVANRLQSIGDMVKAEMERNRLFREEVRHSLAQLQGEVERLSNNTNTYGASTNSNHGDDPRFDVSARISDMLGSTSASITEALLESDSLPATLLAPYGLTIGCLGVQQRQASPGGSPSLNQKSTRAMTTSVNSPVVMQSQIPKQEENFNEVVVDGEEEEEEEEEDDEEEDPGIKDEEGSMDSNEFVVSMSNQSADGTWQSSDKEGLIVVKKKTVSRKTAAATTPRTMKNNYVESEWKKRRARELASARMRRFRERQKQKKGLLQPTSQH